MKKAKKIKDKPVCSSGIIRFDGVIESFEQLPRVLSYDEIKMLYNSGKSLSESISYSNK